MTLRYPAPYCKSSRLLVRGSSEPGSGREKDRSGFGKRTRTFLKFGYGPRSVTARKGEERTPDGGYAVRFGTRKKRGRGYKLGRGFILSSKQATCSPEVTLIERQPAINRVISLLAIGRFEMRACLREIAAAYPAPSHVPRQTSVLIGGNSTLRSFEGASGFLSTPQ